MTIAMRCTEEGVLFHDKIAHIHFVMASHNLVEIAGYGMGYLLDYQTKIGVV